MTIAAAAFAACPLGSRSSGGKCAPAEHGSARLLLCRNFGLRYLKASYESAPDLDARDRAP
jgi:hypothetical protein